MGQGALHVNLTPKIQFAKFFENFLKVANIHVKDFWHNLYGSVHFWEVLAKCDVCTPCMALGHGLPKENFSQQSTLELS